MRILVLYGPLAVSVEHTNELGQKEKSETSVTEMICSELSMDELTFDYPLYNRMHRMILESLEENSLLRPSYFQRLEDEEIVRFVTEIEMTQHELSPNWVTRHNIYTQSEKDKLHQAVMGSILAFKAGKVEKRIDEIRKELEVGGEELPDEVLMDLIAEQVTLEQIKKIISDRLGRIVLR
jgi:DNA primase